jgi:hypothetical protein
MIRRLAVEIECGETTCTAQNGKLCKYLITWHAQAVCAKFPSLRKPGGQRVGGWEERECFTELQSSTGGVQRCQACLDAEKADPAGKIIEAMVGVGACPDFLGMAACPERVSEQCPAEEMRFGTPKTTAAIRACWEKWLKGELK